MTVAELITRHEGKRLKPYTDTMGKLTIGIGRNLTDVGLSEDECLLLLQHDIGRAVNMLSQYQWYVRLDDVRQAAVIDLMFNLGPSRFAGFKNMIAALDRSDYKDAAAQLLDSAYALQVGQRARDLAYMLERGEYNVP
jgi:lysozyme